MKWISFCHIVLLAIGLSATDAMAQIEKNYYTILDLNSGRTNDSIDNKNAFSILERISSRVDSLKQNRKKSAMESNSSRIDSLLRIQTLNNTESFGRKLDERSQSDSAVFSLVEIIKQEDGKKDESVIRSYASIDSISRNIDDVREEKNQLQLLAEMMKTVIPGKETGQRNTIPVTAARSRDIDTMSNGWNADKRMADISQTIDSLALTRKQLELLAASITGKELTEEQKLLELTESVGDISSYFPETEDTRLPLKKVRKSPRETLLASLYVVAPVTPESILTSIISPGSDAVAQEYATPEGTLDYLSRLYGTHDYYETGGWEDPKADSSFPNNIPLPRYDMSDFYRPVWGRITSTYGYRPSFGRIHKGVDLALNEGDTVRAALPGVVSRVGFDAGGYGNFIIIRHDNDMETRYGHLQISLAAPGKTVTAGEAIALGGNSGNSTGPHLHFEARYMGSAVDPESLFDFSGRSMNIYARQSKPVYRPGEIATGFNAQRKPIVGKSTYIVRAGDTIEKIAKRSGISALKLCQLNFITEDTPLEPGRMLKLK